MVARYAESGRPLGADQEAALRGVLTSGAQVEVLTAAAGTGKSFVVGAIADAWTSQHDPDVEPGRVFGLAPYQNAAEVLAGEGLATKNVAAWLATQGRLDRARPGVAATGPNGDDEAWRLRRGDLVVVDEAGTAETPAVVEVRRRCEAAGAKLLLVGDTEAADRDRPGRRAGRPRARTASPTSSPRSAGSATTGKGPRRCGCATATRTCSPSTASTAGSSTPAPPSRPRPPRRGRGWPTPSTAASRC